MNAPPSAPTSPQPAGAPVREGYRFRPLRFLAWLPVYLVLAFSLYALSAGPMYWHILSAYQLESSPWLTILYLPLIVLCDAMPWFDRWMDWYIGLWVL